MSSILQLQTHSHIYTQIHTSSIVHPRSKAITRMYCVCVCVCVCLFGPIEFVVQRRIYCIKTNQAAQYVLEIHTLIQVLFTVYAIYFASQIFRESGLQDISASC